MLESSRLVLLPVGRVVFPGSRHVLMARSDTPSAGGIGAVLEGNQGRSEVGTELVVSAVRPTETGAVQIACSGRRRFRIDDVATDGTARVEFLEEAADVAAAVPARDRAVRALRRFLAVAAEAGEWGDVMVEIAADPVAASYQVASLMRVTVPECQELLELGLADRLERERAVLVREAELLERVMRMERT